MKKTTSRNGFTLIELIIVMVILGIMAAVAVPRYLDSIANAEESAEDAVISAIRNGLKQYANNSLVDNGRATWPTDPFSALSEKPAGHTNDGDLANTDGEWTFIDNMDGTGRITHQRASALWCVICPVPSPLSIKVHSPSSSARVPSSV